MVFSHINSTPPTGQITTAELSRGRRKVRVPGMYPNSCMILRVRSVIDRLSFLRGPATASERSGGEGAAHGAVLLCGFRRRRRSWPGSVCCHTHRIRWMWSWKRRRPCTDRRRRMGAVATTNLAGIRTKRAWHFESTNLPFVKNINYKKAIIIPLFGVLIPLKSGGVARRHGVYSPPIIDTSNASWHDS